MPVVSVIIPTFNRSAFLKKAVASILAQTFEDFEIIIVDDGSSDDTRLFLSSVSDKRVKSIFTKRIGAARARNEGCKIAGGNYLAFCDSDDLWQKNKLELQMPLFEKDIPPVLVFSNSEFLVNDEPTGQTIFSKQRPFKNDAFYRLLMDNFIPTSTAIVKKEAFFKTPGFENAFCPAEDYRLWLELVRIGSIDFVDAPLAYYRVHEDQVGSDIREMFPACTDVINQALAGARMSVKDMHDLDKRLWQLHFVAARQFMKSGEVNKARRHYSLANQYAFISKSRLFGLLSYFGI